MKKDIVVYIEDIIESTQKISEYTGSLSKDEFNNLVSIQDAILMRLAVIGESASKIPVAIRKKHHTIPWRKIINLRNVIVHDYTSINIDRIWGIIQKDIPLFQEKMTDLKQTLL